VVGDADQPHRRLRGAAALRRRDRLTADEVAGALSLDADPRADPRADRGPLSDPTFLLFVFIAMFFVLLPNQSSVVLTVHMTSQGFSGAVVALATLAVGPLWRHRMKEAAR
jgi:hypothetical protein